VGPARPRPSLWGDRGDHASLGCSWLGPPFTNKLGIRHLLGSNLTTDLGHIMVQIRHCIDKPAVVDNNFAPGAATLRTGRNIHVIFNSGPLAPFVKTWRHQQYRKYFFALWSEEDRATWNFHMWFLRYSIGQTDRHTDTLIAILCALIGGKVTIATHFKNTEIAVIISTCLLIIWYADFLRGSTLYFTSPVSGRLFASKTALTAVNNY